MTNRGKEDTENRREGGTRREGERERSGEERRGEERRGEERRGEERRQRGEEKENVMLKHCPGDLRARG